MVEVIETKETKQPSIDAYAEIVGKKVIESIRQKAKKLAGRTVLNVNATKFGGGVAEILNRLVPGMNQLGINAQWEAFTAPSEFFEVSKKMHNAIQGNMSINFSEAEVKLYRDQARSTYEQIHPDADFVIIHDPQPCAVIDYASSRKGKWIWRCHIDPSTPNPQAWDMISPSFGRYDALVFHKTEYAPKGLHPFVYAMPPSIDPFSEKNHSLDLDKAREIVQKFVSLDKPLITQVSRFDPWKDPLGVIDAYRIIKQTLPLRLALVGSLASDDPEGVRYLDMVKKHAQGDPDIIILSNLDGVGDREVNAFQRVSDVIIQKSLKEGFGLTVAEALWKGTPVVGGNVGGIQLQIQDGISGFLVNSIRECAEKTRYLLKNPKIARTMGKKGHEWIRSRFLLPKDIENHLDLLLALSSSGKKGV